MFHLFFNPQKKNSNSQIVSIVENEKFPLFISTIANVVKFTRAARKNFHSRHSNSPPSHTNMHTNVLMATEEKEKEEKRESLAEIFYGFMGTLNPLFSHIQSTHQEEGNFPFLPQQ